MTDIPIPADPRDIYAKAAFRKAQSVYREDYDHSPMTHTWETTDEAVRDGWRAIAFAAVQAHADYTSDADLEDVIHEALADSMDMDWTCDVGAKAVVKVLAADRATQAERMARLERQLRACQWYWPEDDTSSDACADSAQEVVQSAYEYDIPTGDIIAVARGGVVDVAYCAYLPPADDSDSDDDFWVEEETRESAKAKIDAELARRALSQEGSE